MGYLEISLLHSRIVLIASIPPSNRRRTVFLSSLNILKLANLIVERVLGNLSPVSAEGYMNLKGSQFPS